QQRWGRGERQADLQSPLLAIGEFGNGNAGAPVEADQRQRALDLSSKSGHAVDAPEQVEGEAAAPLGERGDGDVLAHGLPQEELVHLVALGEAELADLGDVEAGDVAAA